MFLSSPSGESRTNNTELPVALPLLPLTKRRGTSLQLTRWWSTGLRQHQRPEEGNFAEPESLSPSSAPRAMSNGSRIIHSRLSSLVMGEMMTSKILMLRLKVGAGEEARLPRERGGLTSTSEGLDQSSREGYLHFSLPCYNEILYSNDARRRQADASCTNEGIRLSCT